MFSGIRRVFGSVAVRQRAHEIVVEGIPADVMVRDIARIWKTSKISMNMFNTLGKSAFSFNSYFAADIVHMINTMLGSRSAWVSARVLNNIKAELMEHTWLKQTIEVPDGPQRLDLSRLDEMKYPPLAHQLEFLKWYSSVTERYGLNGYLLYAAPGAGKTLNSLQLAQCAGADKIVIIVPKVSVDRVWRDTLTNDAYKTPEPFWVFSDGKPYNGERTLVAHYEGLQAVIDLVKAETAFGSNVVVILDESHNLNEINSLRTNLFIELCQLTRSRNVIWCSGTGLKAMGAELIPLQRTIDPLFTPDTEARFKKIYGKDASKALDLLQNRMGFISFKVEKKELKLEPPIFRNVPVKVPNGELYTLPAIRKLMEAFIAERVKYYADRRREDEAFFERCLAAHKATLRNKNDWAKFDEYYRQFKVVCKIQDPRYCGEEIKFTNAYEKSTFSPSLPAELRKEFQNVKSIIKYVKLKIQGECLGRVLGRVRIECGVALTREVDFVGVCESTLKKTVVFTSFVEALRESDVVCRNAGLKPILVYGATNNELAANVAKFEKDPTLNPLCATYQSLSTAVPLTMADTMILLNSPFRDYILQQAISRIHRIGQDSQTVINQMSLDTGDVPNISTRSNEILAWSQSQVEAITGIKSPFQAEEVAGLEAYAQACDYNEHRIMYSVINDSFENYDITLGQEEFMVPQHFPKVAPAYSHW